MAGYGWQWRPLTETLAVAGVVLLWILSVVFAWFEGRTDGPLSEILRQLDRMKDR